MSPLIDLATQGQGVLPIERGGTGNDEGYAASVVEAFGNETGVSIALGSVVKRNASYDGTYCVLTTTANEREVMGVLIGRWTAAGKFEETAPLDGQLAAVLRYGRARVLVAATVSRGDYAASSTTAGQAKGTTVLGLGVFGRFLQGGGAGVRVLCEVGLHGLAGAERVAAYLTELEDELLTLDLADSLRGHTDAGTVALEVHPNPRLYLLAASSELADAGGYFAAPSPATGTETLRPTSDAAKSSTGITYSAGTDGWPLVDEVTLDTTDYWHITGTPSRFLIHGFPAPTSAVEGTRIDSVVVKANLTNGAPAAQAKAQVRDPQTGRLYPVGADIGQSAPNAYSTTLTTRPWDAKAWTLDDVRHLQFGFEGPTSTANLRIRQAWIEINYTNLKTAETTLAEVGPALGAIRSWKAPVRLGTVAALPAYTRTGNVLLADVNGALPTIDGVAPAVGNRILLKDGVAGADNGIYLVDALGAPDSAGIAEVTAQRNTNGTAGATTIALTYPTTPVEGQLLVAGLSWRSDATISGVPTGWNLATAGGNGAGIDSAIYYKVAGAAEPTVHTWTFSASVKSAGAASAWSNGTGWPAGTGALDKTNSNSATGSAGTTGATGVLAQADELVVTLFSNIDTSTWSAHDNGQTEIGEAASTDGATSSRNDTSLGMKVVASTASVNYGATLSASQVWSSAVATFKSSAATGAKWQMTRTTDADSSAEVKAGLAVMITEGSTLADTIRALTTNDPIILNTTALTFAAPGVSSSHVLATGTALGPDHTMSGAAAGEVLRALSATAAAFDQLGHGDLSGVTADQHHAPAAAGPDANVSVDNIGAAGTAGTLARSQHGHQLVTYGLVPAASTAAGVDGTAGTAPSRGNHAHPSHVTADPTIFICSTALTLGTADADVAGCTTTFTPAVSEVALVTAVFDFNFSTPADTNARGELVVDGVGQTGQTLGKVEGATTGRMTVTQQWVVSLSAASHTLKLRASKSAAAGTISVEATNTRLSVLRFRDI